MTTSSYESLSHAKWDGKYHVVFIPKGRKKALYPTFKGCLQLIDILGQILGLMSDTQKEFLEKSNTCEATP